MFFDFGRPFGGGGRGGGGASGLDCMRVSCDGRSRGRVQTGWQSEGEKECSSMVASRAQHEGIDNDTREASSRGWRWKQTDEVDGESPTGRQER